MDRCLQVSELIRLIFSNLDKAESLSLALSRRDFLEPGLDRIWHSLQSLEPLVCSLPSELWKNEGEEVLVRHKLCAHTIRYARTHVGLIQSFRIPVTESHLQRHLSFYANRIHSWSPCMRSDKRTLSGEALQALQIATNFKLGVLSPHLRHFYWSSAEEHWPSHPRALPGTLDPYVSLFVGESVESLQLGKTRDGPIYLGSLTSTTNRLPHLKSLSLSFHDPDPEFMKWYMTSFPWQGLEELRLTWISPEILAVLAKLPRLRDLDVFDESGALYDLGQMDAPEHAILSDFPSIRSLSTTEFGGLSNIKTLLRAVPPANKIEAVRATSPLPTDMSEFIGAVSSIQKFCNPATLRQIEVDDGASLGSPHEEIFDLYLNSTEDDIDISGLSKFTNLEKLELRWQRSLRLTPREVTLVPTWWPRIRHLDLCPTYPSQGRIPSIDHTHLLDIVRGCPLLRFLGLRFDATQIPGKHQGDVEVFRLETLKVGESPIVSPSRVAAFLKRHFPHLKMKIPGPYDCPVDRETTILDRRWVAVAEALR